MHHESRSRIVVLTHARELGGGELALIRMLEALPTDAKKRVTVVTLAAGPFTTALRKVGVDVHEERLPDRTRELSRHERNPYRFAVATHDALALMLRLARFSKRHAAIIQSVSLKTHLISIPPAILSNSRLIWYMHDRIASDYMPRSRAAIFRILSRVPSAVVVNSKATSDTIPVEATIIYPGYTPDQELSRQAVHSRKAVDPPVVTLLGRVSPTKGQDIFVSAIRQLVERYPKVRFRIVGAPLFGQEEWAAKVQRDGESLGLPLEWVGHVSNPKAEIDQATVVVHASPVPEPFGQVVLEACVRGAPVIATSAGGVPEIVGEDALLVPPGDAGALAEAISECLVDPIAARDRAIRAYESAILKFPIHRTASAMMQVWRSVDPRGGW